MVLSSNSGKVDGTTGVPDAEADWLWVWGDAWAWADSRYAMAE